MPRSHINWINLLFLTITPVIGILGTLLLCMFTPVTWPTWLLAGCLFAGGGLAVSAGYHRLFSHRSYQAKWPIRLLYILLGAATFQGSVLEWATDHRNHHQHTDTDQDPYSISKGFWHAHIGWLFTLDTKKRDFRNVEDLQKDPLLRFQHRYYFVLAIVMGFLLPAAIATLWGEPLAGLVIAGALRMTIGHHATFCINSLCHMLGERKYGKSTAANNWLSSILTFGEGYHNYHHRFPIDYRNGVRSYQFDPGKWFVRGLWCVGLTSNLRVISKQRIAAACAEAKMNSL